MENNGHKVHNRIHSSAGDIAVKTFAIIFIGIIAIACFYPLLMVLSVSLSDNAVVTKQGFSAIPQAFTLDTYRYLFTRSGDRIARSYVVTIAITVIGTLGAMLITSMISFALSIKDLKYRNAISFICNFTIIFSAGLIPWFIVCNNYYHLRDTYAALILPSMFSVWSMFLLRTYFGSVPVSLYESAKLDGASWYQIWWKIALPLNKTAMLTVGMIYALGYWNEWWNSLMFIDDHRKYPLQYILYNVMSNVKAISSGKVPPGAAANIKLPSETMKMAVTIITIGPIIFLYPFVQKYFVDGIMTGAVKE
jgi:putative aldouronate transport system permease protein